MTDSFPHGFRVHAAGIDYQPVSTDFAQGAFLVRWSFKCPACSTRSRFTTGLTVSFADLSLQRRCETCTEGGE